MMAAEWRAAAPSVDDYLALRAACGLGQRSREAAQRGLGRELFALSLYEAGRLIAMGRIVGDGGVHALLSDMAVHPDHQGQGWGRELLERLNGWADAHLAPTCYLSLIASTEAEPIYARSGFDRRIGMGRHIP